MEISPDELKGSSANVAILILPSESRKVICERVV